MEVYRQATQLFYVHFNFPCSCLFVSEAVITSRTVIKLHSHARLTNNLDDQVGPHIILSSI